MEPSNKEKACRLARGEVINFLFRCPGVNPIQTVEPERTVRSLTINERWKIRHAREMRRNEREEQ